MSAKIITALAFIAGSVCMKFVPALATPVALSLGCSTLFAWFGELHKTNKKRR